MKELLLFAALAYATASYRGTVELFCAHQGWKFHLCQGVGNTYIAPVACVALQHNLYKLGLLPICGGVSFSILFFESVPSMELLAILQLVFKLHFADAFLSLTSLTAGCA